MKIRDVEDGDCYYEGIVVTHKPLTYKITNIVWDGVQDTSMNGQIIKPKWYYIEIIEQK